MLQFLKAKRKKKSLEITVWTDTNAVRSEGYRFETLCHLQLDFYIHHLNLCWIIIWVSHLVEQMQSLP